MNPWILLAQVGTNDVDADTPLKKALWYIFLPLLVFGIIFVGGYLFRKADLKARAAEAEAKRSQTS